MSSFRQVLTPNPFIPCAPGWCLQYVRQAFGLPARYPSATAAWNASATKHRNTAFPGGMWLPLWFAVAGIPEGHVVLKAPDGSIYSTSDNSTKAHHHPDLADLMAYYARYGKPLTYLGWTEDVSGTRVTAPGIPKPAAPKPVVKPAPARPANGVRLIRVEAGDTLSGIAAQFRTTVPHLAALNGIRDVNKIFPGQLLKY